MKCNTAEEKKEAALENHGQLEKVLQELSSNIQEGMPSTLSMTIRMWPNDRYSIFSMEPLYILFYLCIPEKLQQCTDACLRSEIAVYFLPRQETFRKRFSFKKQLLVGCNNLLVGYKHYFLISNFLVEFLLRQKFSQLKVISTSAGVKGMPEEKDFSTIDTTFSFPCHVHRYSNRANLKSVLIRV